MFSAQTKLYRKHTVCVKLATPIMGVAFLLFTVKPTHIYASSIQICNPSNNCSIGEFLFDDDYVPETTATCTLTSKYPDGSAHLSSQSLSSTSDGWYGHTFSAPTTTGYYRAEICCDNTDGDHMCIDKSFEIKSEASSGASASDIASAVWGYSGRTLTSFNSLVSDIWNYTSSTLTLTKNSPSADLAEIKQKTSETRLLVEELVNKPIIENSLEDVKDLDLGDRIKSSKAISNELYINLLLLDSSFTKTNRDWNKLSDREILDVLTDAKNLIGDESDSSSSDTFFGKVNFLRDTWGMAESDDLREEMKAIKTSLGYVVTGVSSYGKNKTLQKEISGVLAYIGSSEKILSSLNKKISDIDNVSSLIDSNLSEVNKVLGSWSTDSYVDIKDRIDDLSKNIIAINRVPKGNVVIDSVYADISGEKKLKNKVLGLRALLFANKKMLLGGQKTAFAANWLEEGSIVIKTLITNPSLLISQDVPLKYYLPQELKKEHIIDSDAGVEVKYDTEKDQLYVDGNFKLKAGETKTIKVRVEDVWIISESEIDSLLKQAQELLKPLEKTAFFAQGISLKSDIDVSLGKAKNYMKDDITPEAKIKSFREANLEIVSSKEKIEKLKDLVSEAQSSGSILGFVGGSQAIAVWGVVIAIVTAFVFMSVYMRKLLGKEVKKATVEAHTKSVGVQRRMNVGVKTADKIAVFLVIATISALSSSIAVKKFVVPKVAVVRADVKTDVLGSATINYKQLKVVNLVSVDGVVKTYQNEGSNTVYELVDSGEPVIEVERGEKRARVVYEGREVWVGVENVLNR